MKLKEYTAKSIELTDKDITLLNHFIGASNVLFDFNKVKERITLEILNGYIKQLIPFSDLLFVNQILENMKDAKKEVDDKSKSDDKKNGLYDKILKYKPIFENAIKSMDFNKLKGIDITSDFEKLQELQKSDTVIIQSKVKIDFLVSVLSSILNAGNKTDLDPPYSFELPQLNESSHNYLSGINF